MVTMNNALVTSEMGEEKREHLVQMVENAVRKGIKVIGLNDESGQRVVNRGTELVDSILDKIRELSLELPEMPCFGVADWQKLHPSVVLTPKQIAEVAQFPWSDKTLNAPCPFHPGKMIRETHFAFVGLDHVTIAELQKLYPQSGQPRFYSYMSGDAWYKNEKFANKVTLKLRWYLLLKDIVPNSENKTFEEQQALLPGEYEVPSAVAETAKNLFVFQKTGSHANPNRYARTADLDSDRYRVGVGCCGAEGVGVYYWSDDDRRVGSVGVSASRKFE
jgi:hypothetical protein